MIIREFETIDGAARAEGLAVMIDVFRACSTACVIATSGASEYLMAGDDTEAKRLLTLHPTALLVGKGEPKTQLSYHLPNSPTRLLRASLAGRTVIHRTMAGARGVMAAAHASVILCTSFPNVTATARYIRACRPEVVSLVALGHRGESPSEEDAACSRYLRARIEGLAPVAPDRALLRATSGRAFFSCPQEEYPMSDFNHCLAIDSSEVVLRAHRHGNHALIVTCLSPLWLDDRSWRDTRGRAS